MQFDPATGAMKCPFCGQTRALPAEDPAALRPHPLDRYLAEGHGAALLPLTGQALEVACGGCGSVVAFEPPEVAGTCPFYGAALVAQPKAADPLIAPDAVLPARIPKTQAQAEVRRWLETRWFVAQRAQAHGAAGGHRRSLSSLLGLRRC